MYLTHWHLESTYEFLAEIYNSAVNVWVAPSHGRLPLLYYTARLRAGCSAPNPMAAARHQTSRKVDSSRNQTMLLGQDFSSRGGIRACRLVQLLGLGGSCRTPMIHADAVLAQRDAGLAQ
jgi:hypothetical protein